MECAAIPWSNVVAICATLALFAFLAWLIFRD